MRSAILVLSMALVLPGCDDSGGDDGRGPDESPEDDLAGGGEDGDPGPAPLCADGSSFNCSGADHICVDGRCVQRCDADDKCDPTSHCFEGECQPWTLDLGTTPADSEDPDPPASEGLRAGTSTVDVDPPMGISMAGFGFRDGPTAPLNPYALSMGGSSFMWDRPNVKVIALENGEGRTAIVRMPMCYVTDFVRTGIVKELLDRGRKSYEGHIVLVSNHSHSYPGRYWRLLPGLGFEAFGYGEFSQSWWEHLVLRAADAVEAAEDDLRPAALAHVTLPDFDPDNKISRDRRRENARFKDPRMMAIRIDDVSGDDPVLMAVMVEFAMHGTVMENEGLSADAGGAVEFVTEERLEAQNGRPATVIYINGSAGDVSPGGDYLGHRRQARLELIGHDTADILIAAIEPLEPSRDVELAQADRRFPVTRETIGYAEGEFFKVPYDEWDQDAGPFKYGAFQCARNGDEDIETKWSDGSLDCMFSVELVNNKRPIYQYSKTIVTALRIGELHIVTLPGEPTSRLGFDLAEAVSARYGVAMENVAVWGYAQDHQLYLTAEDDWLQGGYNPSMSIWGYRFGDYVKAEAEEAFGAVVPGANFTPAPAGIRPVWYEDPVPGAEVIPTITPGTAGEVLSDMPETVHRFDVVRMVWRGGHPGTGPPDVVLERQDPDDTDKFAPLTWPGSAPYTDKGLRMLVHYEGRWGHKNPEDDSPDKQPWALTWEVLAEFPTGNYRMAIKGKHWTEAGAEPYELVSRVFALAALEDEPMIEPVWAGDDEAGPTLTASIAYPDSPEGSFRLRSRRVRHPGGGAPAETGFTVSPDDAAVTIDATDPAHLGLKVTLGSAVEEGSPVVISAVDAHGNTWRWSSAD